MSDFDSSWMQILKRYFESFVPFRFPDVHTQVGESRPVVLLNKELNRVAHACD